MIVEKGTQVTLKWIIPIGNLDSTYDSFDITFKACNPEGTFLEFSATSVVNSIAPVGDDPADPGYIPGTEGHITLNYTPTMVGAFVFYLFDVSYGLGRILFNCIEPDTLIEAKLEDKRIQFQI